MMTDKIVLDPCCGSRMFYFDDRSPIVLYCDNRELEAEAIWKSGDGTSTRYCSVHPDLILDFTSLPFEDGTFYHVVFDPPHLLKVGDSAWMCKKYGKLPKNWEETLRQGFSECWRVLRPYGTLIFKWNEYDIPVKKVIEVIGHTPLYGHKSGKQSKTHWMAFIKFEEDNE